VIAGIVGDENMRRGPIRIALRNAGFETRELSTTDQAESDVRSLGCEGCLLVIDATYLGERAGRATWSSFLTRHPTVSAVVVACGEAAARVATAVGGQNWILVADPFDAAAVVAAVERHVSATSPRRVRRASGAREAG
jgi:DNA-binding NtrC family response regulator